jgi:hypothetical protein
MNWDKYEPKTGDRFLISAEKIHAFTSDGWHATEVNAPRTVTVNIEEEEGGAEIPSLQASGYFVIRDDPLHHLYNLKKYENSDGSVTYYMGVGTYVENIAKVLKFLGATKIAEGGARNKNKNTKTYRRKKRSTFRRNRSRTRS